MFKIHAIATAVALMAVGSAHALTPAQVDSARSAGTLKEIRIGGASALRLSIAAYVKEICNPNTFHVFFEGTSAQSTGYRAYSCNLASQQGNYAAGTPVLVYKRDAGGSAQGVTPIALGALQAHMNVNAGVCSPVGLGATPAVDAAVANYVCTGTTDVLPDAGISDVEPALLQFSVNLPQGVSALPAAAINNLNAGPLVQALFGVVVNKKAYRALQEAQGIIGAGDPIRDVPADQATWTQADIDSIPSLPSQFVRGALTGSVIGGTPNANARRGWNIVIPASVDANATTKTMNICRRVEGSGTQATTNAFFAGNPCGNTNSSQYAPVGVNGSSGNEPAVVATVTNGTPNLVQEASGAGGVENCMLEAENATGGVDNTAYAIGTLGREANPKRSNNDLGYRYVRIDGAIPTRAEAKAGRYPYVYEATMQWNTAVVTDAGKLAFLGTLRTGFGSPNALAAVDSDTQQGLMSPPASYAGAYETATGNVALFGSRVSRFAGNSCAPLRVTK